MPGKGQTAGRGGAGAILAAALAPAVPVLPALCRTPGPTPARDGAEAAPDRPTPADVTGTAEMPDRLPTGSGDYARAGELARQPEAAVLPVFAAEGREAVEVGRNLTMAATLQGRVDEAVARGGSVVGTALRETGGMPRRSAARTRPKVRPGRRWRWSPRR